MLASDGVFEFMPSRTVLDLVNEHGDNVQEAGPCTVFAFFQGTSHGGRQFLRKRRLNRRMVPLYGKSDGLFTKVSNLRRVDRHLRYPRTPRRFAHSVPVRTRLILA